MNPSVFSNHGVHERDFFQSRDQSEVRRIFDSVGYEISNDVFQKLWESAREQNPDGKVFFGNYFIRETKY